MDFEREFYAKPTVHVAKNLLGQILYHYTPEGMVSGKIIETEAYLQNDPACHASRGMTKRNEAMFGSPGLAYVYLIYGIYACFNIVTFKEGVGEAVLIRALEPLEGVALMQKNRQKEKLKDLCSGPAKLVQALGIGLEHNKQDLIKGFLGIKKREKIKEEDIITTTRIGIKLGADLPLRFYLKNNEFVSKK